ncbi:MAG: hypothetical protein NTV88_00265, partial [Candidatus Micrarchaeota archaeon]|nr:hypothetical protein [Candidatus Micrarchaeota archaeon]
MHMLGSGAWKRNLLIALFFLSLASSISFSLEPFSELAGSVDISLHMQGSTAVVKASYLDFSYYKKDDLSTLPTDPSQFHQPGPTSTQEITYSQKPLIKPKLYFTFDGYKIAGAGGAASCDPVVGSDLGEASCTVFGYIDGTGALKKLEDIQSCGSIMVEYRGESDTPNTHTTSAAIQYCPRRTQAIGALGPAIASVFSSPAVFPICFPVMLIVGMLVASMYYSGRDPLSLFDLTTPRLPRVKPFRIKGGVAPQMIRSMIRRYNKNMMMFQKYLVDSVVGAAENAKMNTAQAKRKANALASGYKRELEKMKLAGKTDPAEYKALTDKYDRAARKLMDKYKPADGKTYQYWADLNETAPKVFQQIYAQWDAKNAMGAARGPGGGIIWKKGSAFWDKMTNASIKFEETKFNQFIQQTPPNASRLTRIVTWPLRAPVKALINGPTRFFDVMMQFRASRVGQRRMTRMLAIGTPLYLALTKKDKQTGERNLRELGKKIQSQFVTKDANGKDKLTGLGAFVKKWKGLEFNKFLDEHNLMRRKAMEIFNFVAFAKFDAVHLLRVKEEVLYSQSLKDVRENQIDELIRAIKTDVKNTVKDKKLSADDQKKMILLYVEVINRMREFRRGTAEQREYQYENLELKVISLTDALKSHLGKSKLASYTQTEKWKETEKFMQALIKNEYKNSNGEIVGDTHEKFAEILKYAKNNKIELTVTEQILKEHKALEHAIASRLLLTRELSEKLDKKGESISRESIEAVSEKKLNDY